jgi:hypothetical protein
VLRRILSREGLHKLSPMWEGPFKVMHIARLGATRNRGRRAGGEPVEHSSSAKVLPVGSSRGDKTVLAALCISSNCSSTLILS